MSYLGRDIEDAISLGILSRDQVPDTLLGKSNREILRHLACDIIQMSYEKDYIAISDNVYAAMKTLREFNFKNIYIHPKLKVESKKVQRSYRILFETLLDNLQKHKEDSYTWKNYLQNKSEKYLTSTTPVQMIVDYVSGMTDGYFIKTLETISRPKTHRIMLTLLIETSTERGLIALFDETTALFQVDLPFGYNNSKYLLPMLKQELKESSHTLDQIALVAVGIGPGSYTGIRIGATVAKTLSFAQKLPLIGICSLEGFIPNRDGPLCCCHRCKNRRALFDKRQ